MYSEALIQRFRNRLHAGDLPDATHEGIARAPVGGPFIRLRVKMEDGRVAVARYKTYGCPAAIACSEVLCELIECRSPAEVGELTPDRISQVLDGVPTEKNHCPALAALAWQNLRPL